MLIVMQGKPGSGKSTIAAELAKEYKAVICSTDSFFINSDGVYQFNPAKISANHQKNQAQVRKYLEEGKSVIVDNTNIRAWEAKPYVEAALFYGHPIKFVRANGNFENTHGVPKDKVDSMEAAMEELSVEACQQAKNPFKK